MEEYDRIVKAIKFGRELNRIILVELGSCRKVLEFGCGTGLLTEALGKAGFEVTAIDPTLPEMARKRLKEYKNIRLCEASLLNYKGQRVDAVVSRWSYHHIPDGEKVESLRNCYRHLKKKGKIIIADEFIPKKATRLESIREYYEFKKSLVGRGLLPVEEIENFGAELKQKGEYKVSVDRLIGQLRRSGFRNIREIGLRINKDRFGYYVITGCK